MNNKKLLLITVLSISIFSACSLTNKPTVEVTEESKPKSSSDEILDLNLFQQATSQKESKICLEILDSGKKDECLTVVTDLLAVDTALQNADLALCNAVNDERYKASCISQIELISAKNTEKEKEMAELEKDLETSADLETKALASQDLSACDKIELETSKFGCRYNILVNQAVEAKDPSLCDGIGKDNLIADCQKEVAGYSESERPTPPTQ